MAQIDITQAHQLAHKDAKDAAQKVADKLSDEFGLECEWRGDTLHFYRQGVKGTLAVMPAKAHIKIKLGFPVSMMASAIEQKVEQTMRKVYGGKG